MSPPVSGRQWGKNPTWHDGILHGPAEFNLGCQRIVVQALKGRRNMCLRVQIVEDSKVYLSMVPKKPDSSLLMWNFYGLHSSHLPHFFCSEQTKLLLPNNFSQGIPGSSINVQRFKRSFSMKFPLFNQPGLKHKSQDIPCFSLQQMTHQEMKPKQSKELSSSASPQGCSRSSDTSFGAGHCSRREMARSYCFLIWGHMLYWSPVERFVYPTVRKHAEV